MQRKNVPSVSEAVDWKKTLSKSVVRSDWPDKDELLDVIYWGRQLIGLFVGVAWGLVPLHGLFAIILYVILTTVAGQFYVSSFQKVDEDALGGFWELAKEGFGAAFATFMVAWITVYSASHYD